MSQDDQILWDCQHAQRQAREQPAAFLREVFDRGYWEITPGRALDIACGSGRNALLLAEKGFEVTGVDISPVALAQVSRTKFSTGSTAAWIWSLTSSRAPASPLS